MKLTNPQGDYLDLHVVAYEFPQMEPQEYDEYDANWLEVTIEAKDQEYKWQNQAPLITTREAMELVAFISSLAEGKDYPWLHFEEPAIYFAGAKKPDGTCLISCGLWLDFHPFDHTDQAEPYILEFVMTPQELAQQSDALMVEVAQFPQR